MMTAVKYESHIYWVTTNLIILQKFGNQQNRRNRFSTTTVESGSGDMLTWIVWTHYIPVNMHTILL